jgi:glycosyltransferase involved in cell wall biosynthesis
MSATQPSARSDLAAVRVLGVQYTNPAAYPPVEHAALLLADAGADVRLLGVSILGDALVLAPHPRITTSLMPPARPGWRQKLHYLRFVYWTLREALRFRPDWIYASDPLSAPAALALHAVLRTPVIYHEHDAPVLPPASAISRVVARCRRRLVRRAAMVVVPSAGRARVLAGQTGRQAATVVWNTPLLRDVAAERTTVAVGTLRVVYQGSIVPARLPVSVIQALALLPPSVTLTIVGYDPTGGRHLAALIDAAQTMNVAGRVHVVGTVASREALLGLASTRDVGLALMPSETPDANEQTMLGASNKPFDYLARGLALVVSDRPDWREVFVDQGYGVACVPESADSIAAALRWLLEHPRERLEMGERGRRRVLAAWHYEGAYRPVIERMAGGRSAEAVSPGPASATTRA